VERVTAALRQAFGGMGFNPADDWLTPYAEVISGGQPVRFQLG
jgi:hypothetical protein